MARWFYMLTAFMVLAAWAGAQNKVPAQPALTAEDKLRLLQANSTVIDNLVSQGVALSNADTEVTRVKHCREASRVLVNAIQDAAGNQNAERVAELSDLLRELVRDGLAPTLSEAKRSVTPESPEGKQLRKLSELAADDLTGLKSAIGTSEKVKDNQRVKDAVKQLDELMNAMK